MVGEGAVALLDDAVEEADGSAARLRQGHSQLAQVQPGVAGEAAAGLEVGPAHLTHDRARRRFETG